ncbi:nucleotidyltransferase family protein [Rubritalea sp.]|uniref:nucleotidyltransferase family protein n=1 Tax=Rubritalea sp. TaxID=2109375 RepID=UPI003EF711AE
MKPTLLVLAAGMGSRYGGLKQMDPMGPNGETVLDYSVFDAIRAGFGKVVFIIRRDFAENFKAAIGDRFSDKIEVEYAYQELNDLPAGHTLPEGRVKPWGTTHAILAARDIVDTPFAVINADDFYGADAYQQFSRHFNSSTEVNSDSDHYSMVGYPLKNTLSENGSVNRGICSDNDSLLDTVEEHLEIKIEEDGICRGENLAGKRVELSPDALVSMNFWGFPLSIMQDLECEFVKFLTERGTELKSECYIPTVVDTMIHQGKADCKILKTSGTWFGVTYPEDKQCCVNSIKQLIDEGAYPDQLWS